MNRTSFAIALAAILGCKQAETPPEPASHGPAEEEPMMPQALPPAMPEPAKPSPDSVGPTAAPSAPTAATATAPGLKAAHLAVLKTLPRDTVFALSVDVGWVLTQAVDHDFGLLAPTGDLSALRRSLSEASVKDFGFDILKAKQGTFWVAPARKAAALWLEGPFEGPLKLGTRAAVGGKDVMELSPGVYMAIDGTRLVVANEAGMELTLAPPEAKLAKEAIDLHTRALGVAGDGVIVASAAIGELATKLPSPYDKLQAGALAIGGGWGVALLGANEALAEIARTYEAARQEGLAMVDKKLAEVRGEENSYGRLFLLTYARAKLDDLAASAKLVVEGDVLSTRVSGGAAAWIAGALATVGAIAVPSFVRYVRQAETAQAVETLDRLYKASEFYYAAPRLDESGKRLPCALPPSIKMTPDVSNKACCPGGSSDKDGDSRCDVAAADWAVPTWSALNFELKEPSLFGYAYESSGVGKDAKFTVSAYADLDCDGVLSTFQRMGKANANTSEGECALEPAAPLSSSNEGE